MIRYALPLTVLLAACAPVPTEIDPFAEPSEAGSVTTVPAPSGLQAREPDTCGLPAYQSFVGQSVDTALLPTDVATRVIRPGEIVSQIYEAVRVNFHVDRDGIITRVACG